MITITEAAAQSGISARTLRNAAKMGWLKTIRREPPWITTMEAVEEFKVWKHVPRPRAKKL